MNKPTVQSRDSSLGLAHAHAQAIWAAPKTLAATISPFLLTVIMASSSPLRPALSEEHAWIFGEAEFVAHHGGLWPCWSDSARMLRARS